MQMTAPLAQASTEEKTIMTEIVKREIAAQQRSMRDHIIAVEEELKQKTKRLNGMFARDVNTRHAQAAKRPGIIERIREEIVECYAVTFATFVLLGEMVGLWEIMED